VILIIAIVFLGAFGVTALVVSALTAGASQHSKQVHATLDSALAAESPETNDLLVNLRKSDSLSSIPWLNQQLHQFELAPRLHALLSQADLKWSAGGLLSGSGAIFVFVGYLAYLRFDSFPLALILGLSLGAAPFGWVFYKRSSRLGKFEEGLPEALDLMVSALRAGHSLVAAMGSMARECADPIGCEFRTCFEEQNFGLDLKTALDNLLVRIPLQDLRVFATAILIQRESGGNLAEVLDKTSYVIRERFRLKRQVRTHTAQGRLTGWILTFLPIVLGFLLYLVNPELMRIMWTTPLGRKLLWIAVSMIAVGGFVINQIVNIDI
jgi:tight adherence protein B